MPKQNRAAQIFARPCYVYRLERPQSERKPSQDRHGSTQIWIRLTRSLASVSGLCCCGCGEWTRACRGGKFAGGDRICACVQQLKPCARRAKPCVPRMKPCARQLKPCGPARKAVARSEKACAHRTKPCAHQKKQARGRINQHGSEFAQAKACHLKSGFCAVRAQLWRMDGNGTFSQADAGKILIMRSHIRESVLNARSGLRRKHLLPRLHAIAVAVEPIHIGLASTEPCQRLAVPANCQTP